MYIGRQISNLSDRVKLDSITASATATYNLLLNGVAYVPSSAESLTVSLNGVIQSPIDSYTCSSSQITFASALTSSDSIDFILAERSITLQTPSAGSVGTSQLASSAVTTAKINADAVDGTKIADNSISDEHLDITAITGHSQKTTLVDADKFLISDSEASGALKYVDKSDLGAGGLKLLRSGSASSGDGYATLTSLFTSTYKIYKIFLYDWNGSLDADAKLQWVTGTNTVESGASSYFFAGSGFNTSNGGSSWSGNSDYIRIAGETIRHDADEHFAWEGTLYNPAGTTLKKRLVFAGGGRRTGNYTFSGHGTAEWNSTTAITGFKIFPSTGTFDSVSWKIYGLVG